MFQFNEFDGNGSTSLLPYYKNSYNTQWYKGVDKL